MRFLAGVLVTLLVEAVVAAALLFTGAFDVAATRPEGAAEEWFFETARDASIRARAEGIDAPRLDDPARVLEGGGLYRDMCASCHGAPGEDPSEIGRGLSPAPEDLAEEGGEWSDAELYWIVSNGIRIGGMPAFGPTHEDAHLWSIVAFVRALPEMTPEQYRKIAAEAPGHAAAEGSTGEGAAGEEKAPEPGAGAGEGHAGHTHRH